MEAFLKSWKFTTHDPDKNALDAYMKAWGLGVIYRTMMNKATPTIRFKESKQQPGKYVLITKSKGVISKRFVVGPFSLNDETTDETRADGKVFKTSFKIEGNKLIQTSVSSDGKIPTAVSTREIDGAGKLLVVAECDGKKVTRYYELVNDEDEEEDGAL